MFLVIEREFSNKMEDKGYQTPEINMGVSTVNRINSLLTDYNNLNKNDYEEKFIILEKLFDEVQPFEEKKSGEKRINEYDNLMQEINDELEKINNAFEKSTNGDKIKVETNILNLIKIFNRKIRNALLDHNLLMRLANDPSKAVELN